MKKIGKVVLLLAIIFIFTINITTISAYAETGAQVQGGSSGQPNINENPQGGLPNIDNYGTTSEEVPQNFVDVISLITTIMQVIGIIVAVIMIIVLGIKYMVGSVEQKADYKKAMLPYLVGAVLVFSIATIVKIVSGLTNSAFSGENVGNGGSHNLNEAIHLKEEVLDPNFDSDLDDYIWRDMLPDLP